jgi:hypothetical protein
MTVCDKCGHGMMMHGCVDGVGYCMEKRKTITSNCLEYVLVMVRNKKCEDT